MDTDRSSYRMFATHPKDDGYGSCDNGCPLSRFQLFTASPCTQVCHHILQLGCSELVKECSALELSDAKDHLQSHCTWRQLWCFTLCWLFLALQITRTA